MARLGCTCGNTLSNVDSPSKDIIYVWFKSLIDSELKQKPDITLWDFYQKYSYNDDDYEYWYCNKCKRVFQLRCVNGKTHRIYKPVENNSSNPVPDNLQELIIYSDIEIDNATESNFSITLSEFLYSTSAQTHYYITSTKDYIYTKLESNNVITCAYELEEIFD